MMFLDTEEILKRVLFTIAGIIMVTGFGLTYYYGRTLFLELDQGKTETLILKDQTKNLNQETDGIKKNLSSSTKDINKSINSNVEETKKVDSDLRSQTNVVKQMQQELDKHRNDTKLEIAALKNHNRELTEQLAVKEQQFNEQLKVRDNIFEKYRQDTKNEITNLNNIIKLKDKEILELRARIDKETEWRNKNYFTRPVN